MGAQRYLKPLHLFLGGEIKLSQLSQGLGYRMRKISQRSFSQSSAIPNYPFFKERIFYFIVIHANDIARLHQTLDGMKDVLGAI